MVITCNQKWLTSQLTQIIHFKWKTPKCFLLRIKCFWLWPHTFLRKQSVSGPYLEGLCIVFCKFYTTRDDISMWQRLWKCTFKHTPTHILVTQLIRAGVLFKNPGLGNHLCLSLCTDWEKHWFQCGERLPYFRNWLTLMIVIITVTVVFISD